MYSIIDGCDANELFSKNVGYTYDDFIILPGGFSYGDYLRSGAIARFAPIMKEIISFAKETVSRKRIMTLRTCVDPRRIGCQTPD